MKKIGAVILAAIISFSLTGCMVPESSSTGANSSIATENIISTGGKIGVCIADFTDKGMKIYREAIQTNLASSGYEVIVVDAQTNQDKQTGQVETLVSQGVSALVVNLVDITLAAEVVDAAKEEGASIVFIGNSPSDEILNSYDKLSFVGSGQTQFADSQVEIIAQKENKGDFGGDGTVDFAVITSEGSSFDIDEFSASLKKAGLTANALFSEQAVAEQTRGYEFAGNAILTHGEKLDVIFCDGEELTLGAKQAIEEVQRKVGEDIYLVGAGNSEHLKELITDGKISGTVFQSYDSKAAKVGAITELLITGGVVEKSYASSLEKFVG